MPRTLNISELYRCCDLKLFDFKTTEDIKDLAGTIGKEGAVFQRDMDELVKIPKVEIPKVFESKEYEKQRSKILDDFQKKQKEIFGGLDEEAHSKGFSIKKTG